MRKLPRVFIAISALVLSILINFLWLYLNGPLNGKFLLGINAFFLVTSFLALILGRDKPELDSKAGENYGADPDFAGQDRLAKLLANEQRKQDDN